MIEKHPARFNFSEQIEIYETKLLVDVYVGKCGSEKKVYRPRYIRDSRK